MHIDATPCHPMRCSPVDETDINAAMLAVGTCPPPELAAELWKIAGKVRRGEVVDGALIVAALRCAAEFLER